MLETHPSLRGCPSYSLPYRFSSLSQVPLSKQPSNYLYNHGHCASFLVKQKNRKMVLAWYSLLKSNTPGICKCDMMWTWDFCRCHSLTVMSCMWAPIQCEWWENPCGNRGSTARGWKRKYPTQRNGKKCPCQMVQFTLLISKSARDSVVFSFPGCKALWKYT